MFYIYRGSYDKKVRWLVQITPKDYYYNNEETFDSSSLLKSYPYYDTLKEKGILIGQIGETIFEPYMVEEELIRHDLAGEGMLEVL